MSTLLGLREYSASFLLGLREYSAQAYFDLRVNESKEGSQVGRIGRSVDLARHWPAESCGTGPASHRMLRRSDCANMRRQCACAVTAALARHSLQQAGCAVPPHAIVWCAPLRCCARLCSQEVLFLRIAARDGSVLKQYLSPRAEFKAKDAIYLESGTPSMAQTRAHPRTGTHWRAHTRCHAQAAHSRRLDFPHVCLFVCPSVCSVCLFVCLCVCVFVCSLLACLLVCAREQRKRCA